MAGDDDAGLAERVKDALAEPAGARLQSAKVAGGVATLVLEVHGLERLERDRLEIAVRDALRPIPEVREVRIAMTADKPKRYVLAVASGKGGVGKSTLAANLAIALSRAGRKVGLVDADTLVIDMPPGTGDVQLTMMQRYKPDGAVIVSTPQDLALMDAARAINMFEQGEVPIVGLVENMAGYICPHCGEESEPFGQGGAEAAARSMGLAFLGRIPLDLTIRQDSDAGRPPASGDGPQGQAFAAVAEKVATWLAALK